MQECYLGYSPSRDLFIQGYDGWQEYADDGYGGYGGDEDDDADEEEEAAAEAAFHDAVELVDRADAE